MLHLFSKRAPQDVDLDKVVGRLKTQFIRKKELPATLGEALGFGEAQKEPPQPARQEVSEPHATPPVNTTGTYTFDLPRALSAIRRKPTRGRGRPKSKR